MKELCIRLQRGADLKKEIAALSADKTSVVLSSVGCLSRVSLRMAGAKKNREMTGDFEIISVNGTVSNGRCHLHLSVSDENGDVYGGHMKDGCIINTTCELVLGILEEYDSERVFDENTGYDEIRFKRR